jgi:cytochrome c-type biogenesis protein CcmH
MTPFFLAAGALLALALGILLPGLFRAARAPAPRAAVSASASNIEILREQLRQLDVELAAGTLDTAQHQLARSEIERRVLDEESSSEAPRAAGPARKTALALALALPLFTLWAYTSFGNLQGLNPQAAAAPAAAAAEGEPTLAQVETMVDALAKRLETSTGTPAKDLEGWTMLARAYGMLQRFPDAARAYERATALAPDDASLIADHADVLAAAQDQRLAGEPMRLIDKALKLDPNHPKALALAGSAAYEGGRFDVAERYWRHARQFVPDNSEFARGLDGSIADAQAAAGKASAPATGNAAAAPQGGVAGAPASTSAGAPPGASSEAKAPAAQGATLSGRVTLAPDLTKRVQPTDTVFVFARSASGPRMPLAILKRTVADLPLDFTLDDSMAMSPQMKLSNFPRVVVGVRVSRSGRATPNSGDLTGESPPQVLGASGLKIVIDSVTP